jgi:preprotein translocase subunit SecF
MEFFSHQTKIPFMAIRNKTFLLSAVVMLLSIWGIFRYGLVMGLEFTGGTQMEVSFDEAVDLNTVRNHLAESTQNINIQSIGGSKDLLIRIPKTDTLSIQANVQSKIRQTYPKAKITHVEYIGPQIGQELLAEGLNAVIFALILTMVYIAFRFEYRFAIAAIIALMHDPIITIGIFSYAQIEFDLISMAGLLTVLGYSLNDTIVVYDRIRENFTRYPDLAIEKTVNLAINETLSRTIITSLLTLMAVLALLCFGGESLYGFSVALTIGIIVGTYSSIYVAGALAVVLGLTNQPQNAPRIISAQES